MSHGTDPEIIARASGDAVRQSIRSKIFSLRVRQALLSLGPLHALVVTDIPDHELNSEDSKLDYLRTMQQKALAFCRSRNIKVKTRRIFDYETNVEQLCVVRMPETED